MNKKTYLSRLSVTGLIYCITLLISLSVFFAEQDMSYPSGIGMIFGPFNYFHLIYEFGFTWGGVLVNVFFALALCVICMLPGRVFGWAFLPFSILWFLLGFFAHVYEAETVWMGTFWTTSHGF